MVFEDTCVPFQALLDYLEGGQTLKEFLFDFPTVTREAAMRALDPADALALARAKDEFKKLVNHYAVLPT